MKDIKKATKEALLARAAQASDSKFQYKVYNSEALNMQFSVKKLPIYRICDIMDMNEGDTMAAAMEMNSQLIYESIPLLQDRELQEAYNCASPHDIVPKVFEENMGEIEKLCKFILASYGLEEEVDDLKN